MAGWFTTTNRFADPTGARRAGQFVSALDAFPVGHLVDLGAGHGGFSKIAADMGWRVTAVDARSTRFPVDQRIRWVVSDVREFDNYADVDVVLCLGLWYHLTLQDQLDLAKRVHPRPLIIDTHVGTRNPDEYHGANPRISTLIGSNGYEGRYYNEAGLRNSPTASWGNDLSFWPTVATLERQLYEAGYDTVEHLAPPHLADRGFFVARTFDNEQRVRMDRLVTNLTALANANAKPDSLPLPTLSPAISDLAPIADPRQAEASAVAPMPPSPTGVRDATTRLVEALARSARFRTHRALRTARRRLWERSR
ncbi:class I SAM-dependent methyltransferase [Jatrophihabitans cynanchi]|uniref:Class I SAM-dependent methyltransferase n=1 Tax=Jatrophihabitans cynanchi TaxID=2944128 RepID=A0ABY7JXH4_9ACTN|nr:class I SAM-dependent methyltransferase [Jatrophihabitans sp. SB3-54]WAX56017.1 class I SAM-dependent methyltransferase [Jatrophihabitans sp. SB3-54]